MLVARARVPRVGIVYVVLLYDAVAVWLEECIRLFVATSPVRSCFPIRFRLTLRGRLRYWCLAIQPILGGTLFHHPSHLASPHITLLRVPVRCAGASSSMRWRRGVSEVHRLVSSE